MRRVRARRLGAAAMLAAGTLAADPGAPAARAEMYRCQGPDGAVLFTGDASQCPGAEHFEPSRDVQRADPSPAPSPRAAAGAPASPGRDEAARAARWKARRRESEAQLARVERALADAAEAVTWCNQGREVYATDPATGLRRELSCERIRAEHERLRAERARLRAYLHEGGLQEECRRAGCLPGWIR